MDSSLKSIKIILVLFLAVLITACKEGINDPLNNGGNRTDVVLFTAFAMNYNENGNNFLCSINSDGTGLKMLMNLENRNGAAYTYDGQNLVFQEWLYNPYESSNICTIDNEGKNYRIITGGSVFICSPFENKICFFREYRINPYESIKRQLCVVNLDGSGLKQLYEDSDYSNKRLMWSINPDEVIIQKTVSDTTAIEKVMAININDGTPRELLSLKNMGFIGFALSVKKGAMAFKSGSRSGSSWSLYKYDFNSNTTTLLKKNATNVSRIRFSPTGEKLLYSDYPDGCSIMNMNDLSVKPLPAEIFSTGYWLVNDENLLILARGLYSAEKRGYEQDLLKYNLNDGSTASVISTGSEELSKCLGKKFIVYLTDISVFTK